MFSREVDSVDLSVSTCDFVLGGTESRGSRSPCVFSVRTILWLDGGILLFCPALDGVWGTGMKCHASYSPSPLGTTILLTSPCPQAIPTGMPGRVPVRS